MGLPVGCDIIEYHPYDTRFDGERDINRRHIEQIEVACAGRDTIRFAVISDTQRWYDETRAAVAAINSRDSVCHTLRRSSRLRPDARIRVDAR